MIETDERLTRSVGFPRDFIPSRTVLTVREAAQAAALAILRVNVLEPGSPTEPDTRVEANPAAGGPASGTARSPGAHRGAVRAA